MRRGVERRNDKNQGIKSQYIVSYAAPLMRVCMCVSSRSQGKEPRRSRTTHVCVCACACTHTYIHIHSHPHTRTCLKNSVSAASMRCVT